MRLGGSQESPGAASTSVLKSHKNDRQSLKIWPDQPIFSAGNEKMEIGPIPGIRSLPAEKAQLADLRPPEILDIEGAARPGDGDRQRGNRKASGAEEDDKDDLLLDAETDSADASSIDYFA
jgi:hypothetical protein